MTKDKQVELVATLAAQILRCGNPSDSISNDRIEKAVEKAWQLVIQSDIIVQNANVDIGD